MNYYTLGIAGRKRAGKNSLARMLQTILQDDDGRWMAGQGAFADTMRHMLTPLLQLVTNVTIDDDFIDSDKKDTVVLEPFGCTLRHMMQTLGTEWGRNMIAADMWVRCMETRIDMTLTSQQPIIARLGALPIMIITDVRFEDEADFIREHGTLVHLSRPLDDGSPDNHVSEKGIATHPDDCYLNNNGTLDQLEGKAHGLVTELRARLAAAALSSSGADGTISGESPSGLRH